MRLVPDDQEGPGIAHDYLRVDPTAGQETEKAMPEVTVCDPLQGETQTCLKLPHIESTRMAPLGEAAP